MKLLLLAMLTAGCASHTAHIAASANEVRAAAISARDHIQKADRQLEVVESSAATIHGELGYVSDDANPIVEALRYGSIIAGCLVAAGALYVIKTKI